MSHARIRKALAITHSSADSFARIGLTEGTFHFDRAEVIDFMHKGHRDVVQKKKKCKLKDAFTDTEPNETTTEDEGRHYKYPTPKLKREQKSDKLSEEELTLDYNYRMAKMALHEFKNLMRSAGIDVSNFDVKITNNRLDFSKIPDHYRGIFELILKNNCSAHSFKARGTHSALFKPFMRQLQNENMRNKYCQNILTNDAPTPPTCASPSKRTSK